MEEDTPNFSADDAINDSVENRNFSENIATSLKIPTHCVKNSRDELLDSLIDAELDESTTNKENANHYEEMLVEADSELSRDNVNKTSIEDINENHEINESEMLETDTDAVNINNTDGHESETLPDSISNDDKFVKPKNVLCHFPLGRIKRIVKADPEVPVISAESLFLISKATELFLRWLGKEVHGYTIQQKKKTIQLRDLNMAISEHPGLEFLDGALE